MTRVLPSSKLSNTVSSEDVGTLIGAAAAAEPGRASLVRALVMETLVTAARRVLMLPNPAASVVVPQASASIARMKLPEMLDACAGTVTVQAPAALLFTTTSTWLSEFIANPG
jgi:hypothetical protein